MSYATISYAIRIKLISAAYDIRASLIGNRSKTNNAQSKMGENKDD